SSWSSSWWCADALALDGADLPAGRRRAGRVGPAAAAVRRRLDGAVGRAGGGRLVDRLRGPVRLLEARSAARPADELVLRPERLVPRRALRLLAVARRHDGDRNGRRDRVRVLGRPRQAARLLRADAAADRGAGRRVRSAGPAPV